MSFPAGWKRQLAQRLVEHAEGVLSPVRPDWAGVLQSELQHVAHDSQALRWAVGCVWASYRARYGVGSRSLLCAIAVGILFAFLSISVMGWMAARAWPHWYTVFAHSHKHLALELWFALEMLPITLVAAACGALLAVAGRSVSIAFPVVSLGVWQIYLLTDNIYSAPAICPFSFRNYWQGFVSDPISSAIGLALPAAALVLGFHLYLDRRRTQP